MIDPFNTSMAKRSGGSDRETCTRQCSPNSCRESGHHDEASAKSTRFKGKRIALTGATGGIARAILDALASEGVALVIQGRSARELEQLASSLRHRGADVTTVVGDLSYEASDMAEVMASTELDVLINTAGVYTAGDLLSIESDALFHDVEVNALACVATMQAALPGMNARGYGRIVNFSSGGGSFGEGLAHGHAAYSISKTALNAATVLAASCARGDVKVNAMCPGWVRTRMGGDTATRSPAEGADTALWLAALPSDGPTGGFFRDRRSIPW